MFKNVTKPGFHGTQNDEEQHQGNGVVSRMSTAVGRNRMSSQEERRGNEDILSNPREESSKSPQTFVENPDPNTSVASRMSTAVGRNRMSSQEEHRGSRDILSSRREENPKSPQTFVENPDPNTSVASRMSSAVGRNRMSSQERNINDDTSSNETDSRRDISVAGRMSNAVGRNRMSSQERKINDDVSSNQEKNQQVRTESPQNPYSDVSVKQRISIVPKRSRNGETPINIQPNGSVSANQHISIVPTRKRAKENDSENVNVSPPEVTYQNVSGEQKYNNPTRGFTGNVSRKKINKVQQNFEESQKSVSTETEIPLTNQSDVSVRKIEHGNSFVANGMASGGVAPYKYAYYYKQKVQKSWTTAKDYSTTTSVSIKPAKITAYDVCIKVKDASGKVEKKYFDVIVVQRTKNTSNISEESSMAEHNNVNETERIFQNGYESDVEYEFKRKIKINY